MSTLMSESLRVRGKFHLYWDTCVIVNSGLLRVIILVLNIVIILSSGQYLPFEGMEVANLVDSALNN